MDRPDPKRADKLNRLWKLILTSSPEDGERIISRLDEETAEELRIFRNPFRTPVVDNGQNRYLLGSYIPLTEKYQKRFLMTGMVGFIYRMLDEFEPKAADKYTSENTPEFSKLFNAQTKLAGRRKPIDYYCQLLDADPSRKVATKHLFNYAKNTTSDDLADIVDKLEKNKTTSEAKQMLLNAANDALALAKLLFAKREQYEQEPNHNAFHHNDMQTTLGADFPAYDKKVNKQHLPPTELPQAVFKRIEKRIREILPLDPKPLTFYTKQITMCETEVDNVKADLAKLQDELAELTIKHTGITAHLKQVQTIPALYQSANIAAIFGIFNYQPKPVSAASPPSASAATTTAILKPDDIELTEDDYTAIAQQIKRELNIDTTREEFIENFRESTAEFLDEYFRYNPDNHVRSAYAPNHKDPDRNRLSQVEIERMRTEAEGKYERVLIPPADSFFRWQRYMDANYEYIRQATDDIYAEKSDVEVAFLPLEIINADTPEEAQELGRQYQRKLANEFDASVLTMKFNNWTLLASHEQNRERIEFYNKETDVLRRILEQHKEDEQISRNIVKQRGENMRKKDEQAGGGANESVHNAAGRLRGPNLERHGAKSTADMRIEDIIPRDHGITPSNEIEVNVHTIKHKVGKRRTRGVAQQTKFHMPSEKPEHDATVNLVGADNKSKQPAASAAPNAE